MSKWTQPGWHTHLAAAARRAATWRSSGCACRAVAPTPRLVRKTKDGATLHVPKEETGRRGVAVAVRFLVRVVGSDRR